MMGELFVHRNALFEDEGLTVDNFAMNNREGILAVARRTDREYVNYYRDSCKAFIFI